jgi:hypothetical protein
MLDECLQFKRTLAQRKKPMLNNPSNLRLLLEADNLTVNNDFQVSGANLGKSRDVAKKSSDSPVIKLSGIFMGSESNCRVLARETLRYQYLLTKNIFIDGDPMATNVPSDTKLSANVPTDTKPSTTDNPPKKKYSPPILTTYGTVRELTKQVGQSSATPDNGSAPFIKSS